MFSCRQSISGLAGVVARLKQDEKAHLVNLTQLIDDQVGHRK